MDPKLRGGQLVQQVRFCQIASLKTLLDEGCNGINLYALGAPTECAEVGCGVVRRASGLAACGLDLVTC